MTIRKQAYEELREMYLRAGLNPANIRRSEMEARMRVIEFNMKVVSEQPSAQVRLFHNDSK